MTDASPNAGRQLAVGFKWYFDEPDTCGSASMTSGRVRLDLTGKDILASAPTSLGTYECYATDWTMSRLTVVRRSFGRACVEEPTKSVEEIDCHSPYRRYQNARTLHNI